MTLCPSLVDEVMVALVVVVVGFGDCREVVVVGLEDDEVLVAGVLMMHLIKGLGARGQGQGVLMMHLIKGLGARVKECP